MSKKAAFHRCLSKLTDAAADPDPLVREVAGLALEHVLEEAERLLHQVEAESLMLDGWEQQAGKGPEHGPNSV